MTRNSEIARAVRHALVMSAVATASVTSLTAQAQDQEQEEAVQTVTVTGSRIPLPNLTSISPVTAISSDDIKAEGVTRVEDMINNLPQAFADFGGNLANGATGASTVNLRGLGSQRTLVLVNGRRLMPGDPTQNGAASADLNQIPSALVERVEVLTGGASAVYGADAVAGVVNFIMNDNFEGVRFDGQYSFYQHKNNNEDAQALVNARNFNLPDSNVMDGYGKDITLLAGVNSPDGRGNATVYVGFRKLQTLTQAERDFSACALNSSAPGVEDGKLVCGGSGTTAPAQFQAIDQATGGAAGQNFTLDQAGNFIPYVGARDAFNFAPTNFYQRPDERKTAGLFAHYDISDKAKFYSEFMFMDDRTDAQIAAGGVFLGSGPGQPPFFSNYLINCNNPFLSAQQVKELCTDQNVPADGNALVGIGRRNVEGGGRNDDLRHTSYRAVVGMRGDISDGWTYDAYGLYGTTVFSDTNTNDFSRSRVNKALLASTDANGNIVCSVNADTNLANDDPACVPYNIFSPNGVTPEQLAYLQLQGTQTGSTTEQVVSGSIAGDLGRYNIKMPGATDGLGIAFGAEYRQEESELDADAILEANDLAGQGAPTLDTNGLYNVREIFTEARLPILQDKNFARVLSVEAGYRYSDYSLGFSTDTYKFGADWAPIDDIRFRGSYQRAVRAPNVQELFLQTRVQLDGVTDPCAVDPTAEAGTLPEASLEQCLRTGLTAAQYQDANGNFLQGNPASQYNGLVGGNPNLLPESSDTISFGLVYTPQFAPGLSVALDYYDIKVEDAIGQVGADFALGQCLDTGDPTFCSLIKRSPTGSLWLGDTGFVIDPFVNTGSQQVKGIDLDTNYRFNLPGDLGRVGLSFIGTYLNENVFEPFSGLGTYDCAGLYGATCLQPSPEWRHKARATWTSPLNFDVTVTWRYIQSVDLDSTSSNPLLSGAVIASDAKLGARNYIDLSGSYSIQKLTLRLGINNLFDKDPPVFGGSSATSVLTSGNTFPQVYDTLGRYVFLGLTADF
jgi:iron complex outermembrane recepter protein